MTVMVGFVTPPHYADPAPYEFPRTIAAAVLTQQFPLPFPEFDWILEAIGRRKTENGMVLAVRTLASLGCRAIGQAGTPFGWVGTSGEAGARRRLRRLQEAAHVPVVTTAVAILDALRALGARRVALAATHYPEDWKRSWAGFVASSGFEVAAAENLADLGLVAPEELWRLGWNMPRELLAEAVRRAGRHGADAVVVTGTGNRTLGRIAELERLAGCPVVAADTVLYWHLARTLELPVVEGSFGTLERCTPWTSH